jgi:Sulfotransferase family
MSIRRKIMAADEDPMPLIFVVGSGRCGSSMVSRVMREHPDALSISELFLGDTSWGPQRAADSSAPAAAARQRADGPPSFDGAILWHLLSTPQPELDSFFNSDSLFSGRRYPRDGRFKPETGIPPICYSVLPMISDDPDTLFDLLAAEVPTWPSRTGVDHYRALFHFLAQSLGKRVIVERSGGSITMVKGLHERFPDARFVHIHRDGPDCAVSMSRRPLFRIKAIQLLALMHAGRPDSDERTVEELRRLVVHPIDTERLMSYPIPLTLFARMWSDMIGQGVPALAEQPPGVWTSMRYEDVLADPATELTRLADFIGIPATPQWLTEATALISRPGPANISAELDPDVLAAVQAACAPGAEVIAAAESRLLEAAGD